jgi:putative ABC transport system ATP-binding protein
MRGQTKTYGVGDAAFQALKGINLTIQRREFVAIMGASGSGKSTLMNVLGCLDTPTEGTYRYEGIAVQDLDTNERSLLRRYALGFVFQGFNLLPRTSSLDNVELPLLYRGVSRKERREKAVAALTSVGLPTKMDSTPAELSGGQQQRVAIARAIVTEPSTLFADEPTGNLDSVTTGDVMELLKRLNEDNNFNIFDTRQIAETLGSTTQLMTLLLAAVAGVSLLVGGIGIMNIMLVSVTERTREIGIRLAIGATAREVLLQFLIEAVTLSCVGGMVGILLAFGLCAGLARLIQVPFNFNVQINVIAFVFAAVVGVLFGYAPARRAARLNPIDALRNE